jgi:hypothetical protein
MQPLVIKTEKSPGKNGIPPEATRYSVDGEDVVENIIRDFGQNSTGDSACSP